CLGADKEGLRERQEFGLIYGGVRFVGQGLQSTVTRLTALEGHPHLDLLGVCLLALDLPFSAIGDTLTLPLTISHTLKCQALATKQPGEWPEPVPVSIYEETKTGKQPTEP